MKVSHSFNKIWFIQSIPDGEIKTGEHIFEDVIAPAQFRRKDFSSELVFADNAEALLSVFKKIEIDTSSQGNLPLIHIDCHGDKNGLCLKNGDYLSWPDIRDSLIGINRKSALNLMIILAACDGNYLKNTMLKPDYAPFFGLIAPQGLVSPVDIETDFSNYYNRLLLDLNADAALVSLNSNKQIYTFDNAQYLFISAYSSYLKNFSQGKGRQARIEKLVSTLITIPGIGLDLPTIRSEVKKELKNEAEYFDNKWRSYFFIDKFPDNAQRFSTTYQEVLDHLKSL